MHTALTLSTLLTFSFPETQRSSHFLFEASMTRSKKKEKEKKNTEHGVATVYCMCQMQRGEVDIPAWRNAQRIPHDCLKVEKRRI